MSSPKVEGSRLLEAAPDKSPGHSQDFSRNDRLRVAFVVQRCGLEVNGGAESLCLQLAQRMAAYWDTEIITTCALDYMTWENFYPPGVEQVGPTSIRRFPVDQPRDVEYFNRLSLDLHARQQEATLAEQETWMRAQGPVSTGLLEHLARHRDSYDAFIFCGYLYATTYLGLPLVRDKAWLAPMAHDEWTIYSSLWDRFFSMPAGFIFNTAAERGFLQRRFPRARLKGPLAGIGVEAPAEIDVNAFKSRYNLTMPFLLYVGRVDESKGCGEMFQYFTRWKAHAGAPHKLVVMGKEVMPVPFHDDIVYLGFVDDDQKWAAMKSCDWLIMPSRHESLSMVLLETWMAGRPALVNGDCAVLTRHCRESHGGLWYTSFREWCAVLDGIDNKAKDVLGRQGQAYVRERYTWKRVESDYLEALKNCA